MISRIHICGRHSCLWLNLISFACLFLPAAGNAQTDLSPEGHPDAEQADEWLQTGNQLSGSDRDSAEWYFRKAYAQGEQTDSPEIMGRAMSGMGDIYYFTGDYDLSLKFYGQADSLYRLWKSDENQEYRAMNKASIANIWLAHGKYQDAAEVFLESIAMMEKSNSDNKWEAVGSLYEGVASVYYELGRNDEVLTYDLKALESFRKFTNFHRIAFAELFVTADYINLNRFEEAESHLKAAEPLVREDKMPDLNYKFHVEYGRLHQKTSQPDSAIHHYFEALKYAGKTGSKFKEMDVSRQIGFLYRDLQDFSNSVLYLEKSLEISRQLKNKRVEAENIKKLAEVYAARKQPEKAAEYYATYIHLHDSLQLSETQVKISEVENQYQNRMKSDSILVLQKDNELQRMALHKKGYQIFLVIAGAVLALILISLLYRNLRHRHKILQQAHELHGQQILQMQQERQLVAAQSLMKGQEEERSRLARDLHDGVGGLLSGVKLSLSNMQGNVFLSEKNALAINTIICQLDCSIGELRRVSHNMMPEALIKYGLKEALENYCESIHLSGDPEVILQTYGLEVRMDQDEEIILYRLVQELLTNTVKHAEASRVLVQLIREEERISLTVEDDGKGFDPEREDFREGAGFYNIRARAGYLNGSADIHSAPGEGTSVTVEGRLTSKIYSS